MSVKIDRAFDRAQIRRRDFLRLAAGAAAVPAFPRIASALDYPARPVRIVEGFGGGSTPDMVSRLIGQWLSARLGQPFVVENRPGAGSNIATETVVTAPADGYTLLTIATANAINESLYNNLSFDFLRDIAPVAGVFRFPMVLLVNPAFPANTIGGFIAYAKANPGKVNVASPGIGTPMHVGIELMKMMAGIDLVHVPYRGAAPGMTDVISGQVQAFMVALSTAIGVVRAGKVRPLAVTGAARSDIVPDVPAMGEVLSGFEASAWDGTGAPRRTPAGIVEVLSDTITAGLANAEIKARVKDLGGDTVPMPAAQFARFLADETAKWAKVVAFSGARAG